MDFNCDQRLLYAFRRHFLSSKDNFTEILLYYSSHFVCLYVQKEFKYKPDFFIEFINHNFFSQSNTYFSRHSTYISIHRRHCSGSFIMSISKKVCCCSFSHLRTKGFNFVGSKYFPSRAVLNRPNR